MNIPSVKSLSPVFGYNAKQARAILEMSRAELETLPAGAARVLECYHPPKTEDIRLHCLNALAETHGVETIALGNGELVEYLNAGDTYSPTLYRWRGRYHVGDWGSLVERHGSMDLQDAILRQL